MFRELIILAGVTANIADTIITIGKRGLLRNDFSRALLGFICSELCLLYMCGHFFTKASIRFF